MGKQNYFKILWKILLSLFYTYLLSVAWQQKVSVVSSWAVDIIDWNSEENTSTDYFSRRETDDLNVFLMGHDVYLPQ